ncbi:hypothetical protein HMPREF9318_01039 [Streptococcus urinalis FB127-CNA-2]|uniref:ROK family protein n=1 Tax=Streptococcus urinalis 2285-97 TaxID=764291 RepID=G5KHA2_9STRE|nr:ROK family protein [Streptococcus urinalis]EHJ56381.1 ROK family protein [Streptococcus urinalis 2285-97]EKS21085.1 hypothetical protein HMPREF9318_01039 [Streptococcus urinalis FB127-CNA-2]VEF31094.1 transcriptional regulator [Streptococcus urinalis]
MIIGIDIGGTSIKAELFDANGQSQSKLKEIKTPIDYHKQTNDILNAVKQLVQSFLKEETQIEGIAISSAGVIDSEKGKVVYSGPTIPNYKGTNLKDEIEKTFKIKCEVENDVNCAALGEMWKGAGRTSHSFICITVGTGIGGAIILNQTLWRGFQHCAGEVGYIPVSDKTWQDLASTSSLVSDYEQLTKKNNSNGKLIFAAYEAGEESAQKVIKQLVDNLTKGLLPLLYIINPEAIIFGGGIFERKEILLPLIEEALASQLQDNFFKPDHIFGAELGNKAGRLGAVYHFISKNAFN